MQSYMIPQWFNGYDVGFELLFAVITITVAIFAYKMYKSTHQNCAKYLSIAFLLIGLSNIFQSIINFLILTKLNENICGFMKIQSIAYFNTIGTYIHMFLFLIGLVYLVYMTFRTENKTILSLLITLSLISMFLSSNALYTFYLISSIYLIIISIYFIRNYLKNKKTQTLLITVAFLFLLFGSIHFLFSVNHQLFYAIGHLLEFVAYVLIIANLIMVHKK